MRYIFSILIFLTLNQNAYSIENLPNEIIKKQVLSKLYHEDICQFSITSKKNDSMVRELNLVKSALISFPSVNEVYNSKPKDGNKQIKINEIHWKVGGLGFFEDFYETVVLNSAKIELMEEKGFARIYCEYRAGKHIVFSLERQLKPSNNNIKINSCRILNKSLAPMSTIMTSTSFQITAEPPLGSFSFIRDIQPASMPDNLKIICEQISANFAK